MVRRRATTRAQAPTAEGEEEQADLAPLHPAAVDRVEEGDPSAQRDHADQGRGTVETGEDHG